MSGMSQSAAGPRHPGAGARGFFAFRPLPAWLSITLVAFLSIGLLDDLRLALAHWNEDVSDPHSLQLHGLTLLGYVVAYFAVLRTPVATLLSAPLLLLLLATDIPMPAILAGAALLLFAPITSGTACTVTSWTMYLAWTVAASALRGNDWGQLFWSALLVFVPAALLGTAVNRFQYHLSRNRRQLEELSRENALIRDDERTALARELHDVVAHELSLISLQITSRSRTDDPAELHRVLDSVRRSTQSALYELRLLVGVLREDHLADDSDLGHLNEDTSVVQVANELSRRLAELGYRPRFTTPPEVDELPSTLSRTLIRIMQETSTNIIKHAPPRCECRADVRVDARHVVLTVRNPLGTDEGREELHHGPTGWGLRGIAERVDLLGGDLEAGPTGQEWLVSARIPLSADEVS